MAEEVEPMVCGGTGDHEGQPVGCCDECCPEWDEGAREAGYCALHWDEAGLDEHGNKLVSFCPVCEAEGADQSCVEDGELIDDHGERGVRPVNSKGEWAGPVVQ